MKEHLRLLSNRAKESKRGQKFRVAKCKSIVNSHWCKGVLTSKLIHQKENCGIEMGLVIKPFLVLVLFNAVAANVGNDAQDKGKSGMGKANQHEVLLNGFTADATHLPLVLKCHVSFSNILLGSITINSKEVNEQLIKSAINECEKTQQTLSTGPATERLRCTVELADANNLTGNEHFRAVYQCYTDFPQNWEEEKVKTASQRKAGKFLTMKSEAKAILKVSSVKINGVQVNIVQFPELKSDAIEQECYLQIIKHVALDSNRKDYKCAIKNKAEYGGTLEITYWWDTPPIDHYEHNH